MKKTKAYYNVGNILGIVFSKTRITFKGSFGMEIAREIEFPNFFEVILCCSVGCFGRQIH